MAPDAVLVLVDGVPLNDPVTGEADLSLVDASAIAAITVIPGAQSARWGPRAAAGVIRIETRTSASADRRLALGAGSFGAWDAALAWGASGTPSWNAGLSARAQDGSYDYTLPGEIGGGSRRRENADVKSLETHAGVGLRLLDGTLDVRTGYDELERGLPGRAFAPSRQARQQSERLRGALTWQRASSASTLSALFAASHQWFTNSDPEPPFGLPYADTTRATYLELRMDAQRALIGDVIAGAGIELRDQHVAGTVLDPNAPSTQLDAGVFVHGALPVARIGGEHLGVAAQARLDRDPTAGGVVPSHSLTLSWTGHYLGLHVAHRSSYSPPTPGDRFFRDAVGIESNPNLAAERVPAEVELGASARTGLAGWAAQLRTTAYRGHVEGMILWAPDYRFVWSPYNQDAKRVGAEASLEVLSPRRVARIAATWTYVRATYDRGVDDDHVQIAYRPRRFAVIDAALTLGTSRLVATTRYTGLRTTAPSTLNTLPAFWTLDLGITHERAIAGWSVGFDLRVDRVFDEDDSLIFGFPEPGRSLRFGVRIAPAATPPVLSIGAGQ
jgi:iron complex outermembrane receptor protein